MSPPARPFSLRAAILVLCLTLAAAACTPTNSPIPTGPAGSGTAACPAAAAVPDDLDGWNPPAQPPSVVPVIINSAGQLVCGPNRVLFTLLDAEGRPAGAADRTARLAVYDLGRDPTTPIASVDGEFVWAIEDEVGIYVANVSFPSSGRYGAEVTTQKADAAPETIRLTFDVQPSSAVVKVGDRAPASETPTIADVGGDPSKISTDTDPDPALYDTSIDQALAAREPFVVIFATPKFCQTAQCGPTLDRIKPFIDRYPTVTFINVEPYKLKLVDGTLQADLDAGGQLQPVGTTEEWRLVNEPTVYVVDRTGVVRANFELIFSDRELAGALDAVK
jgi:hypothetical protein